MVAPVTCIVVTWVKPVARMRVGSNDVFLNIIFLLLYFIFTCSSHNSLKSAFYYASFVASVTKSHSRNCYIPYINQLPLLFCIILHSSRRLMMRITSLGVQRVIRMGCYQQQITVIIRSKFLMLTGACSTSLAHAEKVMERSGTQLVWLWKQVVTFMWQTMETIEFKYVFFIMIQHILLFFLLLQAIYRPVLHSQLSLI